jgi:hypothetical protein
MATYSPMRITEALAAALGEPLPGISLEEQFRIRDRARRELYVVGQIRGTCLSPLCPDQWERLARFRTLSESAFKSLFPEERSHLVAWVQSAPPQHARLAVALAHRQYHIWTEGGFYCSMLKGEAGPAAQAATPGYLVYVNKLAGALNDLEDEQLRALTHAGGWPSYADRLLAMSYPIWRDARDTHLHTALAQLAAPGHADGAIWSLSRLKTATAIADPIVRLCGRLSPSPQMLQIVERFAKPGIARELLAADMARQLQAEMPAGEVDGPPQLEMI